MPEEDPYTRPPSEPPVGITGRRSVLSAALMGLITAGICFGWFYFTTRYLYNGNWTSVYYTGSLRPMPPELASENIYMFPGVLGYDGHFYHLIAHDPLFQRGFSRFQDLPRVRHRRILVPALAALLAFGHSNWVDPAYILVILASVYLGTFWLSMWSMRRGYSPAWGLLFLALPAGLLTMLFVVVDGTLAALTVGFFWYAERRNSLKLFLVLACAALTRETGLFLIGGYCLWLLFQHQTVRAFIFGAAAIPACLWFWFVQMHTKPTVFAYFSPIPLIGIYRSVLDPYVYKQHILLILDYVGTVGILLAFVIAAYYIARRQAWNPGTFMAAAFLVFLFFVSDLGVWREVNSFGRVSTPLLLFVALTGLSRGNWWALAPVALIDLRIATVLVYHAGLIVQTILSKRH
jgi:hypothetical protein